jgi:hypothetical protein
MGRVKDFYWDEINEMAENAPPEPCPPDDLEMKRIDALQAIGRYRAEKRKVNHERPSQN